MRIALVTGGTKGIGYSILESFVNLGIPTIFTGRDKHEVKKIQNSFPKKMTIGMELDLAKMESIESFTNKMDNMNIKPNILIHNAGYLSLNAREKPRNIQKLFMVNTIGPIILTQHFLPNLIEKNKGHVIFNSPPIKYDDKLKYLTPYLQSKFAQTSYMHSLSHVLQDKKISVNSMWTAFPLWTDAISKRQIGKMNECVSPKILARVVEEVIYNENPLTFKGNEIIDKNYLISKNINLMQYSLGVNSGISLDALFMDKLQSK